MSPKQKEIAAQLGISPSTVSRALRNDRRISDVTRARVREAARGINYELTNLKDLPFGMTGLIGLIVQDITNPFYAELTRGVESRAYEEGYGVIICDSDRLPEIEKTYIYELARIGVEAFLITPVAQESENHQALVEAGIPYVLIDAYELDDHASVVTVDHVAGATIAVRHLLEYGHQRIAFIAGDLENPPVATMLKGYESILSAQGIHPKRDWVCEADLSIEGGRDATRRLMEMPTPPTAAICSSDWMAIGVIRAIKELGKKVPDDFSIVGYDDIAVAEHLNPSLTTVSQDYLELGRIATRILIHERNCTKEPVHQRVLLRPRLVARESVSFASDGK